jgi:hypothetical protein
MSLDFAFARPPSGRNTLRISSRNAQARNGLRDDRLVRESAEAARNWQACATIKRGIATSPGERCKPAQALPQSRLAAREIRPAHDSPRNPDSPATFLDWGKGHAAHWPLCHHGDGASSLERLAPEPVRPDRRAGRILRRQSRTAFTRNAFRCGPT